MTIEHFIVYKNHKLARSDLAPGLEKSLPGREVCKLHVSYVAFGPGRGERKISRTRPTRSPPQASQERKEASSSGIR